MWTQVGFMVFSSDVDLTGIQATFDLHTYDNLMRTEGYTKEWKRAVSYLGQKVLYKHRSSAIF